MQAARLTQEGDRLLGSNMCRRREDSGGPAEAPGQHSGQDSKLSTRGTLVDGELRSAQGPGSAPPVWFVFTGDAHATCTHA